MTRTEIKALPLADRVARAQQLSDELVKATNTVNVLLNQLRDDPKIEVNLGVSDNCGTKSYMVPKIRLRLDESE